MDGGGMVGFICRIDGKSLLGPSSEQEGDHFSLAGSGGNFEWCAISAVRGCPVGVSAVLE